MEGQQGGGIFPVPTVRITDGDEVRVLRSDVAVRHSSASIQNTNVVVRDAAAGDGREAAGGERQNRSLGWEQTTSWAGYEVVGTAEGQTLREELVLQPPIAPVLLRLAVDLHVSVPGFDLVEHSGVRKDTGMKWKIQTICWSVLFS